MRRGLRVAGQSVTEIHDVLDAYIPSTRLITRKEWEAVRPFVLEATKAADHATVGSALLAVRYTARLAVWALHQDIPLSAEHALAPSNVERFVGTQLVTSTVSGRATVRAHLRRVGLAARSEWSDAPVRLPRDSTLKPPYTPREVDGFWEASRAQATEHRRRVLSVMLTLGLGAGLRSSQILEVSSSNHVQVGS